MADNEKKTAEELKKMAEELKKMAEEIRLNVQRAVSGSLHKSTGDAGTKIEAKLSLGSDEKKAEITLEVDTLTPTERSVSDRTNAPVRGGEDFWDLGSPKPRVYQKASFSESSLGVTDIEESADAPLTEQKTAQSEKILPRESYDFAPEKIQRRPADNTHAYGENRGDNRGGNRGGSAGRVVNTVNGPRSIPSGSVVTSSYRRRPPIRKTSSQASTKEPAQTKKTAETVHTYKPSGILLREVQVKEWSSDVEFYGRFASDALLSHSSQPRTPYTAALQPVPYFSYVPQYAHMNNSQIEYYRWVRENIRNGVYPECDLPYLQLYIFEIINLPSVISAEEGCKLLCAIWLHYRKTHPRLDGYLCEWFADYCLIRGCAVPAELNPILFEIVPKAQFKEFYLNTLSPDDGYELGRTVLEVSSDYDYRKSRYYSDNKKAYETYIPAAVTAVLKEEYRGSRGIFALDRIYRMTRDSYCGAIVSSGIKRRLDIEFCSFTRRADTRLTVTAIAKYTENKLRAVLGIKAKLGVDKISPEDAAFIDRFFEPLIPIKEKKAKEDLYMPDDYMKNYEADDKGFDLQAAQAIEAQSWINTGRLTGDTAMIEEIEGALAEYSPDEEPSLDGELSSQVLEYSHERSAEAEEAEEINEIEPADAVIPDENGDNNDTGDDSTSAAPHEESVVRESLEAALDGRFREYCRSHGLHEGEIADRINNIFLDMIGDIVLESAGGGFDLIEDYREDVENWLS